MELGVLAKKAPTLAILLVRVSLANVALPLTNSFMGEVMMFNGIFSSTATKHGMLMTAAAGLTIILSAVYTLNMLQKVLDGNTNPLTASATDISMTVKLSLSVIVVAIFLIGVFPKPMLEVTSSLVETLINKMTLKFLPVI